MSRPRDIVFGIVLGLVAAAFLGGVKGEQTPKDKSQQELIFREQPVAVSLY